MSYDYTQCCELLGERYGLSSWQTTKLLADDVFKAFRKKNKRYNTDYEALQFFALSDDCDALVDSVLGVSPEDATGDEADPSPSGSGVQTLPSSSSSHISPTFNSMEFLDKLIWKQPPTRMKDGKKLQNSMHNVLVYLRHCEKFHGLFRFDKFSHRIILHREPFYQPASEKFKIRQINDNDIAYIKAALEFEDLSCTDATITAAISVVAAENFINPPLEYFDSIVWDGVRRLDKWLTRYLGAEGDGEYLSAVGSAWIIAGVARVYKPGCKADNMLVLEGDQGSMKSTALSVLADVGTGDDRESYFCDTLTFADISGSKKMDAIDVLHGKLIVEFAELASLGKKEVEDVKSWITRQVDEGRKAYGHFSEKYPRQFILAGTTNETQWLKDQTGNRRFWPVKCGAIDIDALIADKEQLWAEAVYQYKRGMQHWISKESAIWLKAELEQDQRLIEDIWSWPVEQAVLGQKKVRVKDILDGLGIEVGNHNEFHQLRVIKILKKLKYKSVVSREDGKVSRYWERDW